MTAPVVDARSEVLWILAKERTGIGWTDFTLNFWHGCSKVDTECRLCYAETLSKRYGREIWGATADRWFMSDTNNRKPARWNRVAAEHDTFLRVFCGSMMDWAEIHKDPVIAARMDQVRREVMFPTIEATPHLRWQLLTKRPENITKVVPAHWLTGEWPGNAWIGTSVGHQRSAEKRIPDLLAVPGPEVRFLSVEPLVGPVDLRGYFNRPGGIFESFDIPSINWVIVGGESGAMSGPASKRARRMDPEWARDVVDLAVSKEVRTFVKQTGTVLAKEWGLVHPKGEDPAEWPEWMQVRQFPEAA